VSLCQLGGILGELAREAFKLQGEQDLKEAVDIVINPEIVPSRYAALRYEIVDVVETARRAIARNVNAVMTAAYWEIGRRIVNTEQGGQARAEYGNALIPQLADDLTDRFGRGFSRANLANMRSFYLAWPEAAIFQTVSGKSEDSNIVQTLSGKLQPDQTTTSVSAERSTA
jgi:hypothetical protein